MKHKGKKTKNRKKGGFRSKVRRCISARGAYTFKKGGGDVTLFGKLLTVWQMRGARAVPYGVLHVCFLVLSVVAGVWLVKRYPSPDGARVRRVLFVTAVACLLLEVYKQTVYSFSFDGDEVRFRYQWYVFPFQFCSTPMYVGLLEGVSRGRLHERLSAYLASYAVVAGGVVMVYPAEVLTDVIGVNIQTMVCHGSMISIGIFLLRSGYVPTTTVSFKKAVPVFLAVVGMAAVMNEAAYRLGVTDHGEFNMFYISPYEQTKVPILSALQRAFPVPVPQVMYLVLFSVLAYAVLVLFRFINEGTVLRRCKKRG